MLESNIIVTMQYLRDMARESNHYRTMGYGLDGRLVIAESIDNAIHAIVGYLMQIGVDVVMCRNALTGLWSCIECNGEELRVEGNANETV